jgi:hypothetical protein
VDGLSFIFELEVPELDWPLAERVEAATKDAGCLVAHVHASRWQWRRPTRPVLSLADEREGVYVLSDNADWAERAFTFSDAGAELLARTVLVLAQLLPAYWSLRACWIGDRVMIEQEISSEELAALARTSALDRGTRYTVR